MKKENKNIGNINIEILELQVVAGNNSIFNLILYGLKAVCWNVVIRFFRVSFRVKLPVHKTVNKMSCV